ncbi:hypothetical protein HW555_010308 [Spodoptera exigua]|uniref:Uncharacterized protein n=1 Tax=Spodoptera exigua TaxID=7107 RepID=A0A835G7L0_SPOEX|nr:hypothetical protein HW555_010308 [Spodoptera exigua]
MKIFGVILAVMGIALAAVSGMTTVPKAAGCNGQGPPPGPPPSSGNALVNFILTLPAKRQLGKPQDFHIGSRDALNKFLHQ